MEHICGRQGKRGCYCDCSHGCTLPVVIVLAGPHWFVNGCDSVCTQGMHVCSDVERLRWLSPLLLSPLYSRGISLTSVCHISVTVTKLSFLVKTAHYSALAPSHGSTFIECECVLTRPDLGGGKSIKDGCCCVLYKPLEVSWLCRPSCQSSVPPREVNHWWFLAPPD